MSVVVVATIIPVEGQREQVIAALEAAIANVHAEEGCQLYALHEAGDRLVMIEKWSSAAALGAHGKGSVLAELGAALEGKTMGAADVVVLRPRPAGTPEQGML